MATIYKNILEQTLAMPDKPETYEKKTSRMHLLNMLIDRLKRAQSRGETCPVYGACHSFSL